MIGFIIGLLTVILVLDCLFLVLLILIQLPKKEAGAGIAFGGGATDALFGAGSGNALTKITKYSAGAFLGLSLLLSVMRAHHAGDSGLKLEEQLRKKAGATPLVTPALTPTNALSNPSAVPVLLENPANKAAATNLSVTTNPPGGPVK